MQQEALGKHRAVAYTSRTLNEAESEYSVARQEKLAVLLSKVHLWERSLTMWRWLNCLKVKET